MSFFIITLVSSQVPLTEAHVAAAAAYMGVPSAPDWLAPGKAADLKVPVKPDKAQLEHLRMLFAQDRIDVFATQTEGRRKKLLLADMDSTIVQEETLDELAAHAGPEVQRDIADSTARAMRGEMDFEMALRTRLVLLKGLPVSALEKTRAATTFMPGANEFVRTMSAHGATCVLVTGGFTYFSEYVAETVGFHHHHANRFGMDGDVLSGMVEGVVLDKHAKRDFLAAYARELGIGEDEAIAIGDGSNDLLMLKAAGLGIGFRPKPLLRESLDNCILYGDLTAALYAQGYRAGDIQP